MKRILKILLPLAMICLLLSGCMSEILYVTVDSDGSGTYQMSVGVSEKYLTKYAEANGEDIYELIDTLDRFHYVTGAYYGNTEYGEFSSVEEFNDYFNNSVDGVKLIKEDNGFSLVVHVGENVNMEDKIAEAIPELYLSTDTSLDIEELLDEMVIMFYFQFPSRVYQTDGPTDGSVLENNNLVIDAVTLMENGKADYVFTTVTDESGNPMRPLLFTDVSNTSWFYPAVRAIYNGRLMNGYSYERFGPNDTLTYAQFCQVISNATGAIGESDIDHWAAPVVVGCTAAGYIEYQEEWDVSISREMAVASMMKVLTPSLGEAAYKYTAEDIPDFDSISSEYQEYILEAFNYGLISGVDGTHTFAPADSLTRAQLCQLFYNMGWTYALAG